MISFHSISLNTISFNQINKMSCETLNRLFGLIPALTGGNTNEEIAVILYEHILVMKDRCGPLIHQSIMFLKENHREIWFELMKKIGEGTS